MNDKRDECGCHRGCSSDVHECVRPCVWPTCLTVDEHQEVLNSVRRAQESTPATLIEWIRNPQGSRDVDGDLYTEVVEGGVQVRRVSGSHIEPLSSHVMWHLAQLEDDQTARLAITEMYDDAAAATDEPGS